MNIRISVVFLLGTSLISPALSQQSEDLPPRIILEWEPARQTPSAALANQSGEIVALRGGTEISPVASEDSPPEDQLDEMERYIFEHVNQYRRSRGLPTLKLDSKLCACARDHSNDMRARGFFSHNSPIPGKARFTDRARKFSTTASAENIARGCQNGEAAMQMWLRSPGHLANITGNYTRMGIGRRDGLYTQMFGR